MRQQDFYESWRRSRSAVEPPEHFADGVMSEIRRLAAERPAAPVRASLADRLFARPYVAAALFVVAAIVGLARIGGVLAAILMAPTGGF